jgi:hypothetical protein
MEYVNEFKNALERIIHVPCAGAKQAGAAY